MTNNEPLSGNLNDDGNANGTASSAAHPVDANDLRAGETSGQFSDVDLGGSDAAGRGTAGRESTGAGTDAFGAGTAGVGDGTTGLTGTGLTGSGTTGDAGGLSDGSTGGGLSGGSTGGGLSDGSTGGGLSGGSTGGNGGAGGSNLGDLASDPLHPFDQTNGLVDGLEGDSDEADTGDGGETTLP
jgi:hypothetical protein